MTHMLNSRVCRTFARTAVALFIVICSLANPVLATQACANNDIEKLFGGIASWYGGSFHGRRTASGTTYDMNKLTCAHKTLPFGTKLLVFNPQNGKKVEVVVTDRGPYIGQRVIDLSKAAADRLSISGIGNVVCYAGKKVLSELAQTMRKKSPWAPQMVATKINKVPTNTIAQLKLATVTKTVKQAVSSEAVSSEAVVSEAIASELVIAQHATDETTALPEAIATQPTHQFSQTITVTEILPDAFASDKVEENENTRLSQTASGAYGPI